MSVSTVSDPANSKMFRETKVFPVSSGNGVEDRRKEEKRFCYEMTFVKREIAKSNCHRKIRVVRGAS